MTPKSFSFTVPGAPIPIRFVNSPNEPRIWDAYKQVKFNRQMELKNQYDRQPPLSGPLHLEATFYIKNTVKHKANTPHAQSPPIFKLLNFLDNILIGTLYKKDCTVVSINIKKLYDNTPRTEITLTRLK